MARLGTIHENEGLNSGILTVRPSEKTPEIAINNVDLSLRKQRSSVKAIVEAKKSLQLTLRVGEGSATAEAS